MEKFRKLTFWRDNGSRQCINFLQIDELHSCNCAIRQFAENWCIDEIRYLVKTSIFWIFPFWRDSSNCAIRQFAENWYIDEIRYLVKTSIFWILSRCHVVNSSICRYLSFCQVGNSSMQCPFYASVPASSGHNQSGSNKEGVIAEKKCTRKPNIL